MILEKSSEELKIYIKKINTIDIFILDFKDVLDVYSFNTLKVCDNLEFFLLFPESRSECDNSEFFSLFDKPSFGKA